MRIVVQKWMQAVLVPVAALVALYLLPKISHAVFIFLMAALFALLLNPVVMMLQRARIPRPVGVLGVYLALAVLLVVLVVIAVPPLAGQGRDLVDSAPGWYEEADVWLSGLQDDLIQKNIGVNVGEEAARVAEWLRGRASTMASAALDFGVGVAGGMITLVMVVIISFYMLLDGRRIYQYLCRVLPGDEEVLEAYLFGLQRSFTRYVKGQFLLALVVGLGAGLGVWILGWQIIGVWPEGSRYVLLFGVWAGLTEVIPLLGPWLGAAPPFVMALFYSPAAALGVLIVYVVVQQLENHILVPNIMGTTVGVHPLGVIFALLVGAQVGGILGMLAALPVLSMLKHTMDFFEIEFSRAPWFADDGVDGDVAGSALVPESSGSGSELTGDASGGVAEGSALAEDGVEQG